MTDHIAPCRPSRSRRATIVGLACGALLVTGCSAESLLETALERVEGVDNLDIDRESGSLSLRTNDGEELTFDGEAGTSRMVTEDGVVETETTSEVPDHVRERVALPASFSAQQVVETTTDDGSLTMLMGTVDGSYDELLAELEAAAADATDAEVAVQEMAPGQMAMVIAEQEENQGVAFTLIMDQEGGSSGTLQVLVDNGQA